MFVYTFVCVSMYVCMYVCMYVHMFVYMYVCIHVYTRVYLVFQWDPCHTEWVGLSEFSVLSPVSSFRCSRKGALCT